MSSTCAGRRPRRHHAEEILQQQRRVEMKACGNPSLLRAYHQYICSREALGLLMAPEATPSFDAKGDSAPCAPLWLALTIIDSVRAKFGDGCLCWCLWDDLVRFIRCSLSHCLIHAKSCSIFPIDMVKTRLIEQIGQSNRLYVSPSLQNILVTSGQGIRDLWTVLDKLSRVKVSRGCTEVLKSISSG